MGSYTYQLGIAASALTMLAACGTVSAGSNDSLLAGSGRGDAVPARVTRPSWNPNVSCQATLTTLSTVLGAQRNSNGGATFDGGGFKPGIPDRRALYPPCQVSGVATLVQLNRVRVGSCTKINADGDWTCELTDPHAAAGTPADLNNIHIETDQKFRSRAGWSIPPGGTDIKIQGFVFWDPGHTDAAWHHHSGWEIHSFTAWRPVS